MQTNQFIKPKQTAFKLGDLVEFYSPTTKRVSTYQITNIHYSLKGNGKVAYTLHVWNNNWFYWGVVLESNLLKKFTTSQQGSAKRVERLFQQEV